jgi:hypothetical protein
MAASPQREAFRLTNFCAVATHLNRPFNRIADYYRYHCPQNPKGDWGEIDMRHKAVAAATMIVAAGLIGISQARLPRPVRNYHDRVAVEMSAIELDDTIANWLGARSSAPSPATCGDVSMAGLA